MPSLEVAPSALAQKTQQTKCLFAVLNLCPLFLSVLVWPKMFPPVNFPFPTPDREL